MKKVAIVLILLALSIQGYAYELILDNAKTQVYFSPNGGCTEAIIKQIDKAEKTILVQAYSYTSVPIARALLAAHQRGVQVVIIVDKGQLREKYTMANSSQEQGMAVYLDSDHTIAHDKVMVLDNKVIITGSFNFSKGAELHNSENIIIINSRELATIYNNNFMNHLKHCVIFKPK